MRFSQVLIVTPLLLGAALAAPIVLRPAQVAQSVSSDPSTSSAPANAPYQRRKLNGILSKLNLQRSQLRQIVSIRRNYQPQIRERASSVKTLQAELKSLMASSAEPSVVRSKFDQLQSQRQVLQRLRFESSLAVREVMTPVQRRTFEAELSKRRPNS